MDHIVILAIGANWLVIGGIVLFYGFQLFYVRRAKKECQRTVARIHEIEDRLLKDFGDSRDVLNKAADQLHHAAAAIEVILGSKQLHNGSK